MVKIKARVSVEKTYRCPYCKERATRRDLGRHIEKKHQDMIPEGYTANRVAFNYLNKKTEGHCVICGNETDWNENKCRYERLCNNPACKKKAADLAAQREKNKYGKSKEERMNDPEFQNKMLAGRSISGKYKFQDGGVLPYVGSYEKDFLQFMDVVLNVESKDLIAPGPTIEYYYGGEKHLWITDYWYLPYNIVFDIKDGGKNPNNREMTSYREKQVAKEKAIANSQKYNYLRLTDKQYSQLLELMMELKEEMYSDDPEKDKHIKIYESYQDSFTEDASTTMGTMAPTNGSDNVYVVNYMQNNAFTGKKESKTAICRDKMTDIHIIDKKKKKAKPIALEDLKEIATDIKVYKYANKVDFFDIVNKATCEQDFLSLITNSKVVSENAMIDNEVLFKRVPSRIDELNAIQEVVLADLKKETKNLYSIPILSLYESGQSYNYYRDIDGEYIKNELTNMRSASYNSYRDIPDAVINLVKLGII